MSCSGRRDTGLKDKLAKPIGRPRFPLLLRNCRATVLRNLSAIPILYLTKPGLRSRRCPVATLIEAGWPREMSSAMSRSSKKPSATREHTGKRRVSRARAATAGRDKFQRLTKTLDELLSRLKKTTVSQERLRAEKAKLKKAAAELAREIAERKLAEEWTRRHEAHFRSMIESVKEHAIILLDHDGRIVSWNRGAELISGYEAEEILGEALLMFSFDRRGRTIACPRDFEDSPRHRTVGRRRLARAQRRQSLLGERRHHRCARSCGPSARLYQRLLET